MEKKRIDAVGILLMGGAGEVIPRFAKKFGKGAADVVESAVDAERAVSNTPAPVDDSVDAALFGTGMMQDLSGADVPVLKEADDYILGGVGRQADDVADAVRTADKVDEIPSVRSIAEDIGIDSADEALNVDISHMELDGVERANQIIQERAAAEGISVSGYKSSHGIIPYTKQEIIEKTSAKGDVSGGKNFREFIDETLDSKQTKRYYFGRVSDELAKDIHANVGEELGGYNISISSDQIRHAIKKHGDAVHEAVIGQLPVTRDTFEELPAVFNKPDSIKITSKPDSNGRRAIEFQKRVDGTIITVTGISDGRKNIDIDTVYIRKSPPNTISATANAGFSHTSETYTGRGLNELAPVDDYADTVLQPAATSSKGRGSFDVNVADNSGKVNEAQPVRNYNSISEDTGIDSADEVLDIGADEIPSMEEIDNIAARRAELQARADGIDNVGGTFYDRHTGEVVPQEVVEQLDAELREANRQFDEAVANAPEPKDIGGVRPQTVDDSDELPFLADEPAMAKSAEEAVDNGIPALADEVADTANPSNRSNNVTMTEAELDEAIADVPKLGQKVDPIDKQLENVSGQTGKDREYIGRTRTNSIQNSGIDDLAEQTDVIPESLFKHSSIPEKQTMHNAQREMQAYALHANDMFPKGSSFRS